MTLSPYENKTRTMNLSAITSGPLPRPGEARLEEVCAADGRDIAAALSFALGTRSLAGRPLLFAATRPWLAERGRPYGWAYRSDPTQNLILVVAAREAEALWAVEEALKSGTVGMAVAAVERPSLLATRRIDHAARAGGACGVILRATAPEDLSAAWRRWRVTALASTAHPDDPRAPGAPRLRADLVRSRDTPPGSWILEWDDASDSFGVAAGLADHGLVEDPRTIAA